MKKISLLLLISILLFTSCKEEKLSKVCDVSNPVIELDWLNQLVRLHVLENPQVAGKIEHYIWKGEDVFVVNLCVDCSDAGILIYDCLGNKVCTKGTFAGIDECPSFYSDAEYVSTVWNYTPQSIKTSAMITGYDNTECLCCGGWLFEFDDKTYLDQGKTVSNRMALIDIILPVEVEIEYFNIEDPCGYSNHINVTKIKF